MVWGIFNVVIKIYIIYIIKGRGTAMDSTKQESREGQ
jgi:hypothetical protein